MESGAGGVVLARDDVRVTVGFDPADPTAELLVIPDDGTGRPASAETTPTLRVSPEGRVTGHGRVPAGIVTRAEVIRTGQDVEIIEYDATDTVVNRVYGTAGPADIDVEQDVAVMNDTLLAAGADGPKATWDLYGTDGLVVADVDSLADLLDWDGPTGDALRADLLLPYMQAAPAMLRRDIARRLDSRWTGRTAPHTIELVVLAQRDDPDRLADALLRFPWAAPARWPDPLTADTDVPPAPNSPRDLTSNATRWGVPADVVDRLRQAWRAVGLWPDMPVVPAVLRSDFDGIRHLVALTDDVTGWVVTIDGRTATGPAPFAGGHYPDLAGRPSWDVDLADHGPTVTVHGHRVRISEHQTG